MRFLMEDPVNNRRYVFLRTALVAVAAWVALAVPGSAAAPQAPSAGLQANRIDVITAFASTPGPADEAPVRRQGGQIRYTYYLVPAIASSIPEQAVAGLASDPRVTSIDLTGQVFARDAKLDNTWGVERVGASLAHADRHTDLGALVAVIESGIDIVHPDLMKKYMGGDDFVNGFTETFPAGTYTGDLDLSNVPDGSHTWEVTAKDAEGISGAGAASFPITAGDTVAVTSIEYTTSEGPDGLKHLDAMLTLQDELGKNAPGGCYVTTVESVDANGLTT